LQPPALAMTADPRLVAAIDALLPQTQCRKCGYAGCRPYAEAVADGGAEPNQCPPGGDEVAQDLATLLGVASKPVDSRFGAVMPPARAVIDEALCIGCTLCLRVCPVDAIAGAAQLMHTVIEADCTGCELCLPPCPVDCIRMVPAHAPADRAERRRGAEHARRRFERRERRLQGEQARERDIAAHDRAAKERTVQRALERARLRLAQRKPRN
jgi:electron transport complex protein RnfB